MEGPKGPSALPLGDQSQKKGGEYLSVPSGRPLRCRQQLDPTRITCTVLLSTSRLLCRHASWLGYGLRSLSVCDHVARQMSVSTAASSMTAKWDTSSIQAQCCAVYGMRDLPLFSPISIHNTIARRVFIYLPCSPQSPCCSAFGHSCILGLPLPEHILAHPSTTGAPTAATRIQYHDRLLLSRVVVSTFHHSAAVPFLTPSLRLRASVCTRPDPPRALLPPASTHTTPSHKPGASPRLLLPRLQCTCVPALCKAARALALCCVAPLRYPPVHPVLQQPSPPALGCLAHVFDASLS